MTARDRLNVLIYILVRDELPFGTLERILQEHIEKAATGEDTDLKYPNPNLELYAHQFVGRLLGEQ